MGREPTLDRKIKVLLVEDSESMVNLLRCAVPPADPNLDIVVAGTMAEALAVLLGGGIDAVLLDLGLPDAGELIALATVRRWAPEVPVVVMTGAGYELEAEAIRAGAYDFLVKGTEDTAPRRIARAVRHAVIRAQAEAARDKAKQESTEQ